MRISFLATLVACLFMCVVQAQPQLNKTYSHHLGLQVNPLLKQLVNFGNSPVVDNPFLIKYGIRNNAKQTELMFGFGFRFTEESMESGLKSDFTRLNFRVGYALKKQLGKGFEIGAGLDGVLNLQNNQTVNIQSFGGGIDSTITITNGRNYSFGGGPQLTLSYYITPNVKFGTESTLYFLVGQDNLKATIDNYRTDFNGNVVFSSQTEETEERTKQFEIQLPVALFLSVVF